LEKTFFWFSLAKVGLLLLDFDRQQHYGRRRNPTDKIGRKMDCRQYLERLCWQKLVRDKNFREFLVTKDLELILELEKRYGAFGFKIWVSKGLENEEFSETKRSGGQPIKEEIFWSYHPSPVKILSEAHSSKLIFEIDLDMLDYTRDIGGVAKEIREKLEFEVKSRQGDLVEEIDKVIKQIEKESKDELESIKEIIALKSLKEGYACDTIPDYPQFKSFDRDLEILAFWEEIPDRPLKDIAEKFKISVDTAQKALKRIYELIYDAPYHPKPKSKDESLSNLCNQCLPDKKARCAEMCDELKASLESEIKGKLWGEVPGVNTEEDGYKNKGVHSPDSSKELLLDGN
jgi:hypothetical protein